MPETTNVGTGEGSTNVLKKLNLGKKIGPLPLGVWVIIAGLAIGGYLYWKNSGSPDADIAEEDAEAEQEMEDVSIPDGVGEGPGYTYFPPPVPLPAETTPNINNNQQWARYAIEKTIRETSLSNTAIANTVTRYLAKQPLNENQVAILQQVFEIAGSPPKPLPIIRTKPGGGGGGGGGGGNNPPHTPRPTPGDSKWHKIKRGQTLQGIARRYYERPEQRWRDIFNANRKDRNRPGPADGFLKSPDDVKNHVGRWLYIPGPTKG